MQVISRKLLSSTDSKPFSATEKNWKQIRISSCTLPLINTLATRYEKTDKSFSSKLSCALQMSFCGALAVPEAAIRFTFGVATLPSMVIAPNSLLSSASYVSLATSFENLAVAATAMVAAHRRLSSDEPIDVAEIANKVSFGWIDLSEDD